jgi:hypothetical protein
MHSRTEPEAFFLDLFFNAHSTPDGKQKQKAANALVPSVIAYAGGQMDFTVDMGTEVCCAKIALSIEISNQFSSARHD